jgi:histone-lysine N-methyltransferase SETD1
MSQIGGVPAVGRSESPGSLKRKRGITDYAHSRNSQRAKLAEAAPTSDDLHSAGAPSSHEQYPSPDSDEPRRTKPGDTPHKATPTNLLNGVASSVFGHTSQAEALNKAPSFPNGLTPLTNHSDSPPANTSSPRAAPDSVEMPQTNGGDMRPSDDTQTFSNTRAERPKMHLPRGEVRGYRANYDPELDSDHRKRMKEQGVKGPTPAPMKPIKVRNQFHDPPRLRNMIQAQEIGKKNNALYPFADTG